MSTFYQRKKTDDIYVMVPVYIPKKTHEMLKARSESNDNPQPVSRLIAIAVDNELDVATPFHYPTDLPSEYVEYAYAAEAGRLLSFLQKLPTGIAMDSIVLARRDIGIDDRKILLQCLKELFDKKLIEEYAPRRTMFNYGRGYRRIRVVGKIEDKKKKYKRIEGQSTKGQRWVDDGDVE